MTVRVGINGFGRIGRNFFRAAKQSGADIDFVAVNDLGSLDTMAHLLKYDSVLGVLPDDVKVVDDGIYVDGDDAQGAAGPRPEGAAVGRPRRRRRRRVDRLLHRPRQGRRPPRAGAPLVIVSAPSAGADATFVVGVNDDTFDPANHKVVSNASCTTNCFVPMVKVLDDAFGVEQGLMTTVHAYTGDQMLVDGPHKRPAPGPRRPPSTSCPTSTGAARATGLVLRVDEGQARRHVAAGAGARRVDHRLRRRAEDRRRSVDEINAAFGRPRESGR